MPSQKDFKRLVRARMKKTGESYTAARAHFTSTPGSRHVEPAAKPVDPAPPDYATLAGMSDAAIKAKTGCTWARWVAALDYHKAHTWSHKEIADFVHTKFKVGAWWTQTVTVGYERIKGLRAIGQRRDGSYEATKSRTFAVPVSRVYRAFRDARQRGRWLPDVALTVRTATRDKSMRITWPDGTPVEALFYRKGAGRSQIAIAHRRLKAQAAATEMKTYWTERLNALDETLRQT